VKKSHLWDKWKIDPITDNVCEINWHVTWRIHGYSDYVTYISMTMKTLRPDINHVTFQYTREKFIFILNLIKNFWCFSVPLQTLWHKVMGHLNGPRYKLLENKRNLAQQMELKSVNYELCYQSSLPLSALAFLFLCVICKQTSKFEVKLENISAVC
jgi:hypothetical protein